MEILESETGYVECDLEDGSFRKVQTKEETQEYRASMASLYFKSFILWMISFVIGTKLSEDGYVKVLKESKRAKR